MPQRPLPDGQGSCFVSQSISVDVHIDGVQSLNHGDNTMLFSVIYEAACRRFYPGERINNLAPPDVKKRVRGEDGKLYPLWNQTEGDDSRGYEYLGEDWKGHYHRKWCAVLTVSQFREFVDQCGLEAEACETMGSLGAPGFDLGWAPAISFRSGNQELCDAYVTPIPDKLMASWERPFNDEEWERIKACIMRAFGNWHAKSQYAIREAVAA